MHPWRGAWALGVAVTVLALAALPRALERGPGAAGLLGGPAVGSASRTAQTSATRDARVRQLALEHEEGGKDEEAWSERGDGEDEQQGGIEQVQFGPGWGPDMDRALGNIPVPCVCMCVCVHVYVSASMSV